MPTITADKQLIKYYLFFAAFLLSGLFVITLTNDDSLKIFLIVLSLFIAFSFMIHSLESVYFLFILSIPFSINLEHVWGSTKLCVPGDGFIILFGSYFIIQLILDGKNILSSHYKIISLSVLFVSILIISSFASNLPTIAFKSTLKQISYIVIFLIMPLHLFRKRQNIKLFILGYIIAFSVIIINTIIQHSKVDFNINATADLVKPFYNDHAQYGACLAMLIPILVSLSFKPELIDLKKSHRLILIPLLVIYIVAIYLSHSRAAWISIFFTLLLYLTIKLEFRWFHFLGIFIILSIIALLNITSIQNYLIKNKTDSNQAKSNSADEIKSIGNISNDVSNLERINRWNCAIAMFNKKPFIGFGTGTYQFNYISFQSSNNLTPISVHSIGDNKNGKGGNCHHEYLKLLSESGIFSLISFAIILLFVLNSGYQIIYSKIKNEDHLLIIGAVCGLFTYIVHGFFNCFLDSEKVAVIFWGLIAIILSIYSTSEKKNITPDHKQVN